MRLLIASYIEPLSLYIRALPIFGKEALREGSIEAGSLREIESILGQIYFASFNF